MTLLATSDAAPRPVRMSAAALVRILALCLSTLLGILLARALGAAELGRFEAAMAQAALLGVFAAAGVEKLIVREIAAGRAGDALLRWARQRILLSLATLGAVCVPLALLFPTEFPEFGVLCCGLVPATAFLRMQQGALQGRHRVVAAQMVELVALPGIVLGGVLASHLIGGGALRSHDALILQVLATVAALGLGAVLLNRAHTEPAVDSPRTAVDDRRRWRDASLALLALGGLQVLHARADVAVFAQLAPDAEVGRFAVATRIANLCATTLLVANAVIAPHLARAHRAGDTRRLQAIAVHSARRALIVTLVVSAAVMALPGTVLGLFGDGFGTATGALFVLVPAQVINVAMGSVGLVLLMTGRERAALPGLAIGAAIDLGLLALLAPSMGATGAACARAAGLLTWNVFLACAVRRQLGCSVNAWVRLS